MSTTSGLSLLLWYLVLLKTRIYLNPTVGKKKGYFVGDCAGPTIGKKIQSGGQRPLIDYRLLVPVNLTKESRWKRLF